MPIYLHIEHNISHNVTLHLCFALLCSKYLKKFVQNTYMNSKLRFKPEKYRYSTAEPRKTKTMKLDAKELRKGPAYYRERKVYI